MADFLKAYVSLCKQKNPQSIRQFVSRHLCKATCDTFVSGNFVICRQSGFYHNCSEETCPFLLLTHGRESRVCRLTGFVYAPEFDNHDLFATTSWVRLPQKSRQESSTALQEVQDPADNYDVNDNEEAPQDTYVPTQTDKRRRTNDRGAQTNVDSVGTSRHIPIFEKLLSFTNHAVSAGLLVFAHEACISLERILCVSSAYRSMYDVKYHTLFVLYKMTTGMKICNQLVIGVSPRMRSVLPLEKSLPSVGELGIKCLSLTKYRSAILDILRTLTEDSVRLGLMKSPMPPE